MKQGLMALGLALAMGSSACDLEVQNPNAPGRERALGSAGDVETLIQGSFQQWWLSVHDPSGPAHVLANWSFQWSSWPANFGVFPTTQLPRPALVNDPTHDDYDNLINGVWFRGFRCLSAVAQGLQALEDPEIANELEESAILRARAFGKFMQGLCHGSLALFYQSAWILDETTEVTDDAGTALRLPAQPYTEVLAAALGYFDEAIALARDADFTIPSGWMTLKAVSAEELALLASSMKARYRANVARTPEERADVSQGGIVDWQAVIDEVDAGVPNGWDVEVEVQDGNFWHDMVARSVWSWIGWNQQSYMIDGMADQSGRYQRWLATTPAESRHPDLDDGPFIIVTPDQRFPQGETLKEQEANPGTMRMADGGPDLDGNNWGQEARGTHRWSYYRSSTGDFHWFDEDGTVPEVTEEEMRLLKAEGLLRLGDPGAAADLVNISRTAAGLNATDAAGTNTDCVPRLPDSSCGDLMEMLKWEKRMHTANFGVHSNTWYFDGRGWGDLYRGTPLALPFPCEDAEIIVEACTTTGGVEGVESSPGSIYGLEP